MRGLTVLFALTIVFASGHALGEPFKSRLVVNQSQPAVVDLSDVEADPGAKPEYVLTDYQGKQLMKGAAPLWADGTAMLSLSLAPGYYEINYPEFDKSFGLAVLPSVSAARDPFFCIDAALSWLTESDKRPYLVNVLSRMGIHTVRERLRWGAVNRAPGSYDWAGGGDYDATRRLYEQQGLEVLEVYHDAPGWMRKVGDYPTDLAAAASSWASIAERWGGPWGAIEMWNEPDIPMFSGGVPADQYVPVQKMAAYVFGQKAPFLIGGGVFTHHCPDAYWNLCTGNGFLDTVDFISFHTYDRAPTVEALVNRYRERLAPHGKASMPLWITESGRPWTDNQGRPSREDDAVSALDITMKGIEFRACGGARYFPFVFPYYEERGNIFSMMHRDGSPHRAISAYAAAIHVLSDSAYAGDLACDDGTLTRARAFSKGEEIVVVLYTGDVADDAKVSLPVAPKRVVGIDGRRLNCEGATVPIPDGLTYAWFDAAAVSEHLKTDTAAMSLYTMGHQAPPERPAAPPVLLQAVLPLDKLEASDLCYTVPEEQTGAFVLRVNACNMGDTPQSVQYTIAGAGEGAPFSVVGNETSGALAVPPKRTIGRDVSLQMTRSCTTSQPHTITVTARLADGTALAPLAIALRAEPNLARLLAQYDDVRPFALRADLAPAQSSGTMDLSVSEDGEWRLEATFDKPDGGDHWVYPPMDVTGKIDFTAIKGFVLRAKLEKPGSAHVLLFEEGGRYGFFVSHSLVPDDGEWHAAEYLFEDVVNMPTHTKPSGMPDWNRVDKIAVGFSTKEDANTLMVSDFHVVAGD